MQAALALRVPLAPGGPRVEMGSSQSCAHAFCGADGAGDEVTRLRSTKKLGHVQRALDSLVHCGGGKRAGGESSGTAAEPDAPGTSGSTPPPRMTSQSTAATAASVRRRSVPSSMPRSGLCVG